jgi:hypothetical protein
VAGQRSRADRIARRAAPKNGTLVAATLDTQTPVDVRKLSESGERRRWILWAALVVVPACVVIGILCFALNQTPEPPPYQAELDLCREFADLKSRGDPRANALLGPERLAPAEAMVSPREAEQIDADAMLRGKFEVEDVYVERPQAKGKFRIVLIAKGNFDGKPVTVRTPDGPEKYQRHLFNPEIVVEVIDGKINGILARVH